MKLFTEITSTSVSDDDYFTYLTPEGELYDKSVLPSNEEEKTSQIKRENKAYSYKEQLEEIQLRKELELKKGKSKEVQLTPKQKEAVKNQLEKESAIRAKLKSMNDNLEKGISQVQACLDGSDVHLSLHYKKLLPVILEGLRSPLLALPMANLYLLLGSNQTSDNLGRNIALSTIRMYKPKCVLPEEWSKNELSTIVSDILNNDLNISEDSDDEEEENDPKDFIFTAPTFVFIFQFSKHALTAEFITTDELSIGIEIISKHAQMTGSESDEVDQYHPKFICPHMQCSNSSTISFSHATVKYSL